MKQHPEDTMRLLDRVVIGTLILLAMLLFGIQAARAGASEVIPSIGLTRAVHGDDQISPYAQLALRTSWTSVVMTELGVGYRQDKFNSGDVTVRSWPLTATLWLSPIPTLYAGGGLGWYNNSIDYAEGVPYKSRTTQKLGVHLGAGMTVPVAPMIGLDLNAKYAFLETDKTNDLSFDPSHWTTSAGIAIKF